MRHPHPPRLPLFLPCAILCCAACHSAQPGQEGAPRIALLPTEISFTSTAGCGIAPRVASLYNTGPEAITVQAIEMQPADGPFVLSTPPAPFTVAQGGKVSVGIGIKARPPGRTIVTLIVRSTVGDVSVRLVLNTVPNIHAEDRFSQATAPKVDFLVVMDDSSSFDMFQSQLAQQATSLIRSALATGADFHIGVTTNDPHTNPAGPDASLQTLIYPGGLYGSPAIITSSTPDPVGAFVRNVTVGTAGTGDPDENGLQTAWYALLSSSREISPPQGSAGFLRSDARLVILDVQDDDDESSPSTDFYVDFFRDLKGAEHAGMVTFHAIGGFDPETGLPGVCSANGVLTEPSPRYYDVATRLEGKTWSLCSTDWGSVVSEMGQLSFTPRKQYTLSRKPEPSTLRVAVNGSTLRPGTDYTFDRTSNTIGFSSPPPSGAGILVDYDASCPASGGPY